MRRTKLICTIGPASDSPLMLEKLAKAGMNIARLNFSHGSHEEHLKRIKVIEDLNARLSVPVGLMLDTQGPEIRLGSFDKKAILQEGAEVTLTTKEVICDNKTISINYKKLPKTVNQGDLIFIADGTIQLKVKNVAGTDVLCEVVIGGEVDTKKNVSIPDAVIDLPSISEKDVLDIKFGVENNIDFIAQSFVRSTQDVIDMRELVRQNNSDALIIAKIECLYGVKNIDEILAAADGIMIARGDLGVQIPIEQVPNAQKLIIKKCNEVAGKPVIVATQMLESMTKNPLPTRAEATDVANAIIDGTDAIMLSGETAIGKYPLRAVEMVNKIAMQTEAKMDFATLTRYRELPNIENSIGKAVCHIAHQIKAVAIITCTLSGHTARVISRNKPSTPIIAVTPNEREIKKLNLWWGVHPLLIQKPKNTDDLIQDAIESVVKADIVKKGDTVVLTAGIPFIKPGNMNMIKVHVVE